MSTASSPSRSWPTSTICPSATATSTLEGSAPVPSKTTPPRKTVRATTLPPVDRRASLARPEGFEPPTLGSEDRCSGPLSYGRAAGDIIPRRPGDARGTRTHALRARRGRAAHSPVPLPVSISRRPASSAPAPAPAALLGSAAALALSPCCACRRTAPGATLDLAPTTGRAPAAGQEPVGDARPSSSRRPRRRRAHAGRGPGPIARPRGPRSSTRPPPPLAPTAGHDRRRGTPDGLPWPIAHPRLTLPFGPTPWGFRRRR